MRAGVARVVAGVARVEAKRGHGQQVVLRAARQTLVRVGVGALLGRVQQDPVQRVEELGLGLDLRKQCSQLVVIHS